MDSLLLSSLTSSLSAQTIDTLPLTWKEISALPLADPTFCTPGSINVIVGFDQLRSLYTGQRKYFGKDYPIALNTIFGCIIAGSYAACDDHITPAITMDNAQPTQTLLDSSDPTKSHFANTYTRSEDGVYIVEYPFKDRLRLLIQLFPRPPAA